MRRVEMVGKKFNRLTVLREAGHKGNRLMYQCVCDCGTEVCVLGKGLRSGHTKSCGCLSAETRPKAVDLSGQKFGRLTAVEQVSSKPVCWKCMCDCGREAVVQSAVLASGNTRSCGCLYAESRGANKLNRGYGHTKVYDVWFQMMSRCHKPENPGYPNYGGRGIEVCESWRQGVANFVADMGEPPEGMSLERVDNNGNYEPGNCVWATRHQQQRNQRTNVKVAGVVMADWARALGVVQSAINSRVTRHGETHEEAIVHFATKGGYL